MNQEYRIYRATKSNTGCATKFQIRKDEETYETKDNKQGKYDVYYLFMESVKQTGMKNDNATFAWDDPKQKVTMKLGITDIGDILAVLNSKKTEVGIGKGIYHKNPTGDSGLMFKFNEAKGYTIRISRKKKTDKEAFVINFILSFGEAEVLRVLLEEYVRIIHGWEKVQVFKKS